MRRDKYRRKKTSKVLDWINYILLAGFVILAGSVLFQMFRYNLLAFRFLNIIVTLLVIFLSIGIGALVVKKKAQTFTILFLIFGIMVTSLGVFGIQQFVSVTSKLNETATVSAIF